MERLELKFKDAQKALTTLEDILKEKKTVIIRDASIQRFEYTFEAIWKFVKEYLREKEGIVANSPKSVFRELLVLELLTEEQVIECLEMTDRRNDTSHTYKEKVADAIYGKCNHYSQLMRTLLDKFKNKIK